MAEKLKSARLRQAEEKVMALREQLLAAEDERDNAIMEDCGLRIGGIVRSNNEEWKVSRVSAGSGVYGFAKKKDGSWSSRERYVGLAGFNVEPVIDRQIDAASK